MGSITDATILHHVCIVLISLWLLNSFDCCHPIAYFLGLIYLYLIHDGYVLKLRKKLQFEEKRESNQRRVLSDSETVRWLNHAVEKIWPLCMEEIVSQKILLPIVPWFLQKYKPWTVKDIEVQHLYLGRSPPIITEMRVLPNPSGEDHLVLELGLNFRTADDMSAILGVKLTKRLGFGMWAKLHLLGMHVEGKVLVGVKFLRKWPFIGRLRVCFAGPPYFQMTVKPIFTHGLDVTELPGIAGWIDNLLAVVFEQTLVEPNMLVVDVEKFASPQPENWFSVDAKDPIAFAIVEVLEASEMKPSDMNGLADPYVKGRLGQYRFRTKTRKKTLTPKWQEEFKIPITSWDSENTLVIEVRDKDRVFDDTMGDCTVSITELRGGQRHDLWLPLQNIKMGRLHLAITVTEANEKDQQDIETTPCVPVAPGDNESKRIAFTDAANKDSFSSLSSDAKSPKIADSFEPIDIEGKPDTGIWIHHPGSELSQVWEPRKARTRRRDPRDGVDIVSSSKIPPLSLLETNTNDSSSTDENPDQNKGKSRNSVRKGFRKLGSVFQRSPRSKEKLEDSLGDPEPSPHDNIKSVNTKNVGVRLIIDEEVASKISAKNDNKETRQGNVKDRAKSILKQGVKSARDLRHTLSRKGSRNSDKKDGNLEKNDSFSNDGGDDCNVPSLDASSAKEGLIIASDVSGRTSTSEHNSNNSTVSFKDGDVAVRKEISPRGNNSFGSEDGVLGISKEDTTATTNAPADKISGPEITVINQEQPATSS